MPARRRIGAPIHSAVLAAILLLTFVVAAPGRADIVRLTSGDAHGNGWMFLDIDGVCKIVTAGHVVRGRTGRLRPILAIDPRGRQFTTGAPTLLSDDPDVAVLPVPSAIGPSGCGDGRLSAIGVARRVTNLSGAFIRTTGQSEVQDIPAVRTASIIDSAGGAVFAVRAPLSPEILRQGLSGSVVLDRDGPVGIVFAVDEKKNEAYAVRVDVIRSLMLTALPPAPTANLGQPAIAVLAGATPDPNAGPDRLVGAAGTAWRVTPNRRSVVVTLNLGRMVSIQRVSLTASPAGDNRIEALDISSRADVDEPGWTWANYCRAVETSPRAACSFLNRTVVSLRVMIKTRSDDPIDLSGLIVE